MYSNNNNMSWLSWVIKLWTLKKIRCKCLFYFHNDLPNHTKIRRQITMNYNYMIVSLLCADLTCFELIIFQPLWICKACRGWFTDFARFIAHIKKLGFWVLHKSISMSWAVLFTSDDYLGDDKTLGRQVRTYTESNRFMYLNVWVD